MFFLLNYYYTHLHLLNLIPLYICNGINFKSIYIMELIKIEIIIYSVIINII